MISFHLIKMVEGHCIVLRVWIQWEFWDSDNGNNTMGFLMLFGLISVETQLNNYDIISPICFVETEYLYLYIFACCAKGGVVVVTYMLLFFVIYQLEVLTKPNLKFKGFPAC